MLVVESGPWVVFGCGFGELDTETAAVAQGNEEQGMRQA